MINNLSSSLTSYIIFKLQHMSITKASHALLFLLPVLFKDDDSKLVVLVTKSSLSIGVLAYYKKLPTNNPISWAMKHKI